MIKKYLKQYLKQIYTKIGIVAMIIFTTIYCNNDYMEFKNDDSEYGADKKSLKLFRECLPFYKQIQYFQIIIYMQIKIYVSK